MITDLNVQNIGVIRAAQLALKSGLIAITGETGAGKSMLLGAISLICGENPSGIQNLLKDADSVLIAEARLENLPENVTQRVDELGGYIDDNSLTILRKLEGGSSRFKASVGSVSAPKAFLKEITNEMIAIHGQSEQLALKSHKKVRELIDSYADLGASLEEYSEAYGQYCAAKEKFDNAKNSASDMAERVEFLKFAVEKIDKVRPAENEDVQIKSELSVLQNVNEIGTNLGAAVNALSGEDDIECENAQNLLLNAVSAIYNAARYDESLQEVADTLEGLRVDIAEVKSRISDYLQGLDYNPTTLESLNRRLSELGTLTATWGPSINDTLEFYNGAVQSLQDYELDSDLDRLEQDLNERKSRMEQLGATLSEQRATAAKEFSANVSGVLLELGFNSAEIVVNVERLDSYNSTGHDEVSIAFAPHKSSKPSPLEKVASGGELSRIMLAIEIVLARKKYSTSLLGHPTLIFDEVDAGIGGETSNIVAKLLKEISSNAQVIVVTHLANVAAKADQHFVLEKTEEGEKLVTTIKEARGKARVSEIARMLSGSDSAAAISHAEVLLGGD
jgi:DNA repair protein RecN (Recombination protein N)